MNNYPSYHFDRSERIPVSRERLGTPPKRPWTRKNTARRGAGGGERRLPKAIETRWRVGSRRNPWRNTEIKSK